MATDPPIEKVRPTSPPADLSATPVPPPDYSLLDLTEADHDDYQNHLLRHHLRTLGIPPDLADTIPASPRSTTRQPYLTARARSPGFGSGGTMTPPRVGGQVRAPDKEYGVEQRVERGSPQRKGWARSLFEWISPPVREDRHVVQLRRATVARTCHRSSLTSRCSRVAHPRDAGRPRLGSMTWHKGGTGDTASAPAPQRSDRPNAPKVFDPAASSRRLLLPSPHTATSSTELRSPHSYLEDTRRLRLLLDLDSRDPTPGCPSATWLVPADLRGAPTALRAHTLLSRTAVLSRRRHPGGQSALIVPKPRRRSLTQPFGATPRHRHVLIRSPLSVDPISSPLHPPCPRSEMPFFQSLSALFGGSTHSSSSSSRGHAHRRSVINSTFDAFSLPAAADNAHYGNGVLQTDSASSSPGPSRRGSEMYASYPPPKDTYQPALTYYPPLSHTFHRLRNSLADSFPELLETLNPPASASLIATFEGELGCSLPPPVRDSFLAADGQDPEAVSNVASSSSGGLFFGLQLLPLEEVMREWAFWRQAEQDPLSGQNPAVLATMASVPPGWIKSYYACRGWVPLLSDRTGNYVGVDLDPGPEGSWGQVIVFGRDFDRKCVLWRGEGEGGWGRWLAGFVDELESGEGWEADKSNSSDEEEEVGYGSYNGGGMAGESGKGLRLAGEYRGWNVLEAWWDRSVRQWEGMNLGMDVEQIERGLAEARKLAGYNEKGKTNELTGLGVGMRVGDSAAQVEIPVFGSPYLPHPSTPVQGDSDVLLPPASPENPPIPPIKRPPHSGRIITPVTTTSSHPLAPRQSDSSGYLSPPSRSPPRDRRRSDTKPLPQPTPIDLPTRADVQAMSAIAQAEAQGLRGGWVMNLDTSAGSARRRAFRDDPESEMVDIDLEGGKAEKFGSPRMSSEDILRQGEEEKLAIAGVEHRRSPAVPSPQLVGTSRTPSPLIRNNSQDGPEETPRAAMREPDFSVIPPSVKRATEALRRPPPIANHHAEQTIRSRSSDDDRETTVAHSSRWEPRKVRESSVISTHSQDGLLDAGYSSRSSSPPAILINYAVSSPIAISMTPADETRPTVRLVGSTVNGQMDDVEREMEDVSL